MEKVYLKTNGLIEKYTDNENIEVICSHMEERKHTNKYTYFNDYYVGTTKPSYTIVETIEQETNTYKYGVNLADCWFVEVKKDIIQEGEEIDPTQTNIGEMVKGKYTFLKETTSTENDAINNIKDEEKKKSIQEQVKSSTNRIKSGITAPTVTFDFAIPGNPTVNVSHNINIKSVIVYQQTSTGVRTSSAYPTARTASIGILGNSSASPSNPILPITNIKIEDVNGNKFEFDGTGKSTSSYINITRKDELTLQTYEYTKTDEQTTTVTNKTKYPVTEGETIKDLYDSKDEKFLKAYHESSKAKGNIGSTPGWLEEMLDEYDSNFTTIIEYLIDIYKYGHSNVEIDKVLDLYDVDSFQSLGFGQLGVASVYNYIRAWECDSLYEFYIGETTTCPKYVDGEYYKVYYGGRSDPTYNIAYGIVISRDYNDRYFNQKGVSTATLRSYTTDGAKFTALKGKEVEEIFNQIIDKYKNAVESSVAGLNLSQNQKDALTAIKYQYGNIGNFKEAYNNYYIKGDIEGFKRNFKDTQGYQPLLDTSTNNKEKRISERVKANLDLFINNKYVDKKENVILATTGSASDVVNYALSFEGKTGNDMKDVIGFGGEWCAAFVSHCYKKVGLIPSVIDGFYVNCSGLMNQAKSKGIWHNRNGYIPKAGDVIFYDWNKNAAPNHVGLVVSCDGSNVYTIEGNTGNESSWRSRKVMRKTRSINSSYIMGYLSPTK